MTYHRQFLKIINIINYQLVHSMPLILSVSSELYIYLGIGESGTGQKGEIGKVLFKPLRHETAMHNLHLYQGMADKNSTRCLI